MPRHCVVVGPPRTPPALVERLGRLGTSTVHEAIGRRGYLGTGLRPVYPGARLAGTAVTVSVPPGDNLMVHVAVEQVGPGDVLVISPTSPCIDGYIGELFATALARRGAVGIVADTGVRDVAALRESGFPVWARAVSSQGTVKASPGSVNVAVVIGGVVVRPGDAVIADDDGVVVVAREEAEQAASAGEAREQREAAARARYQAGELSLDVNGLRPLVAGLGIEYLPAAPAAPVDRAGGAG